MADDFPGAAETLAMLLEADWNQNHAVVIALDGAEAVKLAMAHRPDVAILDIEMPFMSGVEVAGILRDTYACAPPLLIAITGGARTHVEASAANLFDYVMRKPVDMNLLLERLQAFERNSETSQPESPPPDLL